METKLKVWTGLGLATALAGTSLAGCSRDENAADTADPGPAIAGEAGGEGEGGEGEGGVDFTSAATDPVEYGSALAVAEAHAIAARDAFAIGRTSEAAEMFGHPVSEVLADMDPVFAELGVADMKPLFLAASAAAQAGESQEQVTARFDDIMEALDAAKAQAPDDGTGEAMVAAGVAADQIERAVTMYQQASQSEAYEPYLDGYGFYKAAQAAFDGQVAAIRAEDADLHASIAAALKLLSSAYPSVERPATLAANQGELLAAGSRVNLAAQRP